MAASQNPTILGTLSHSCWMFIPPNMVIVGFDPFCKKIQSRAPRPQMTVLAILDDQLGNLSRLFPWQFQSQHFLGPDLVQTPIDCRNFVASGGISTSPGAAKKVAWAGSKLNPPLGPSFLHALLAWNQLMEPEFSRNGFLKGDSKRLNLPCLFTIIDITLWSIYAWFA